MSGYSLGSKEVSRECYWQSWEEEGHWCEPGAREVSMASVGEGGPDVGGAGVRASE